VKTHQTAETTLKLHLRDVSAQPFYHLEGNLLRCQQDEDSF